MSGPCCNEAEALTLCCFVFLSAWNIDSSQTDPTHLPLIGPSSPQEHSTTACLPNGFCSFPSDCKLRLCRNVNFSPILCVLTCSANLVLSSWMKDNGRQVGDKVVINKGHPFIYSFASNKLLSVDVVLVVNQIRGLAESRKLYSTFFFFPMVPRGYFSSHYNSIHGPCVLRVFCK